MKYLPVYKCALCGALLWYGNATEGLRILQDSGRRKNISIECIVNIALVFVVLIVGCLLPL